MKDMTIFVISNIFGSPLQKKADGAVFFNYTTQNLYKHLQNHTILKNKKIYLSYPMNIMASHGQPNLSRVSGHELEVNGTSH